jgi:hypothetical protein
MHGGKKMRKVLIVEVQDLASFAHHTPFSKLTIEDLAALPFREACQSDKVIYKTTEGTEFILKDRDNDKRN